MKDYCTPVTRHSDIKRGQHVIDARGRVLGQLASEIAKLLMGKDKPYFCRYLDCGDFVKVIHAHEVKLTGNKLDDKIYYHHSGYPAGLKAITARKALETKPEWVVRQAVQGMLPHNRLRQSMLKRLEVFSGDLPE